MAAAVPLRRDYDAKRLRALAKRSHDSDQTRRLLALAEIYDGGSRGDAAKLGGVGLQTIRDWVLRFNANGPAGLLKDKAPGKTPLLDEDQRRALAQRVESGPVPAVHGVVRWRLIDLAQWVFETYRISVSKQVLSRYLRAMGYWKLFVLLEGSPGRSGDSSGAAGDPIALHADSGSVANSLFHGFQRPAASDYAWNL